MFRGPGESGGAGGLEVDWTRACQVGGIKLKVSVYSTVPAYSLLKQKQLQLAQASFRDQAMLRISYRNTQ